MANFCGKCGNKLEGNESFCGNCGNPVGANSNNGHQGGTQNINQNMQYVPRAQLKSKIGAGILGIFLGWLGIHNFYLGYTGKAIAQLLITCLSCGTFSFISIIWGFIEGILILTGEISQDAEGNPLGE